MRRASVIVGMLFILSTLAPAALADPKGEPETIDCEGVPSITFTSNKGNGAFTPGFDVGSTAVYIPYAFEFAGYFTPEGGGEEELIFEESVSKRRPPANTKTHSHGVCTFGGSFPVVDDPDLGTGTVRFTGTAWVFSSR